MLNRLKVGLNLKKLIIKTAAITFAIIIAVASLVYGALVLFAPRSLAAFYEGVGNYGISVDFYEMQYNKTADKNDLYTLCIKVDEYLDAERAKKYLELFVDGDSASFNAFCTEKDSTNTAPTAITTKEYAFGKLVCAIYSSEGIVSAVERAEELVEAGYTEFNPYYVLITDKVLSLTVTELSMVEASIEAVKVHLSGNALAFAERDLALIESAA